MREVIMPTIQGMKADGITYTGFLYAGLMIAPNGQIKTLEFNCRMGDPETQPIMARLRSDLVHALDKAVDCKLDEVELEWDRRTALGVVLAAHQYPDAPRKGDAITGIPIDTASAITFHAGTTMIDGALLTNGGRVLCVVGLADTVRGAQKEAYQVIEQIHFDGMQYRQDIGHRALK
jgi:phosphoribosylamine--glycine ligase